MLLRVIERERTLYVTKPSFEACTYECIHRINGNLPQCYLLNRLRNGYNIETQPSLNLLSFVTWNTEFN